MLKKLTLLAMAVAALAAFVVPASASATGRLEMGGKLIPNNTAINLTAGKGTEHELITETSLGTIECGSVEIFGEVTLNNGEEFAGGSNEEKEGVTEECFIEPGHLPTTITKPRGTIKSTTTGTGLIGLTFIAHIAIEPGNEITCHFYTGANTTEPPENPETTGVFHYKEGSSTAEVTPTVLESECGEAEISGSVSVETSNGEPIEIR